MAQSEGQYDPTAPDIDGARKRYPKWHIYRDGFTWVAEHRTGLAEQLESQALETLESKLARTECAMRAAADAAQRRS